METLSALVRRLSAAAAAVTMIATVPAWGQTPQPFPRPGQQAPPPASQPPAPDPEAPQGGVAAPAEPAPIGTPGVPSEAELGVPVYPAAVFLTSYDAGRGQRFYLFGVASGFEEMVTYYRNVLKDRGDRLYNSPPTHMFETGRFRDESMAFPPSVTVKDYTFGGSAGYPNPVAGADPARFPTVIQIVAAPAGSPQ
ncbi:MAG: hypothetical protein AB7O67_06040 [Vicinamibacterales bacterium]